MKKIYSLILFGLTIIATSCKHQKEPIIDSIQVTHIADKQLELDEIVSDYDWILLDSADHCMLAQVNKIVFYDNHYYILDMARTQSIMVFDERGSFVNKIGMHGNGHGEYTSVSDFVVKKNVYILSNNTIFEYGINGNFINKYNLGENHYSSISVFDDGFLLSTGHCSWTSGEKARLFTFYDNQFNIKERQSEVLPFQIVTPTMSTVLFQKVENNIYYIDEPQSCIHVFEDGNIDNEKIIKIVFDKPMAPEKFQSISKFDENFRKYDFIYDILITERYYYITYVSETIPYVLILDKNNKEYIGEISNKLLFAQTYYNPHDGYLYSVISPDLYLNQMEETFPMKDKINIDYSNNILLFKWKCLPQ